MCWLYQLCNNICVHSCSAGYPTLTRTRWSLSCHTWRGTNWTWQKWVGILYFWHKEAGTHFWRDVLVEKKKCAAVVQIEKTACAGDGAMCREENKLLLETFAFKGDKTWPMLSFALNDTNVLNRLILRCVLQMWIKPDCGLIWASSNTQA